MRKKYVTAMAAKCTKMATFEQTIKELLEDVNSVTDSVLDIKQEKEVLESGRVARAICFYHVCIFTAFTFYNNPGTWQKDASAAKAMETLKTSLQSLLQDEDTFQVEQARDDSFVKKMREEAKVLKPADVVASAAPLNWSAWENIQRSNPSKKRRKDVKRVENLTAAVEDESVAPNESSVHVENTKTASAESSVHLDDAGTAPIAASGPDKDDVPPGGRGRGRGGRGRGGMNATHPPKGRGSRKRGIDATSQHGADSSESKAKSALLNSMVPVDKASGQAIANADQAPVNPVQTSADVHVDISAEDQSLSSQQKPVEFSAEDKSLSSQQNPNEISAEDQSPSGQLTPVHVDAADTADVAASLKDYGDID